MNIIITSAGRRVSLVRAFQKELKILFPGSKVFTAELNPERSSACFVSDKYFKVPGVSDPAYIRALLAICLKSKIKIVIPTIDIELPVLAENKKLFAENDIKLIVPDEPFVKICRDKRLTHKYFDALDVPRARELDNDSPKLPVFMKPYNGSGSKGAMVIKHKELLEYYSKQNGNKLFLEYFDPQKFTEFTVDLYYDKNSNLKCIVPRERIEVRDGEVIKGITRKNLVMPFLLKHFSKIEGSIGCIIIQLFLNKETSEIFASEINARFGGGYPLSYLAGANFPAWIIREYMLGEAIPYYDDWEDNLLMLRYDDEIIVRDHKLISI